MNPDSPFKHATVSQSQHVYRKIIPEAYLAPQAHTDSWGQAPLKIQDLPCVEVTIPEGDWHRIQAIVNAHVEYCQHTMVQDAWEKYQIACHLCR